MIKGQRISMIDNFSTTNRTHRIKLNRTLNFLGICDEKGPQLSVRDDMRRSSSKWDKQEEKLKKQDPSWMTLLPSKPVVRPLRQQIRQFSDIFTDRWTPAASFERTYQSFCGQEIGNIAMNSLKGASALLRSLANQEDPKVQTKYLREKRYQIFSNFQKNSSQNISGCSTPLNSSRRFSSIKKLTFDQQRSSMVSQETGEVLISKEISQEGLSQRGVFKKTGLATKNTRKIGPFNTGYQLSKPEEGQADEPKAPMLTVGRARVLNRPETERITTKNVAISVPITPIQEPRKPLIEKGIVPLRNENQEEGLNEERFEDRLCKNINQKIIKRDDQEGKRDQVQDYIIVAKPVKPLKRPIVTYMCHDYDGSTFEVSAISTQTSKNQGEILRPKFRFIDSNPPKEGGTYSKYSVKDLNKLKKVR